MECSSDPKIGTLAADLSFMSLPPRALPTNRHNTSILGPCVRP